MFGPVLFGRVLIGLIGCGLATLGPGGLGSAGTAGTARGAPPANTPPAGPTPGPQAAVVESFTRSVQPLLLNRCATAGCHVGPKAAEPRFLHRNARGHIDRQVTLANLETVTHLTANPHAFERLVQEWLTGHPRPADTAPLDQASANALRKWLAATREIEARPAVAGPPPPNRFQAMLEAAANPVPLWPPPQAPRGILLRDDRPSDVAGSAAD